MSGEGKSFSGPGQSSSGRQGRSLLLRFYWLVAGGLVLTGLLLDLGLQRLAGDGDDSINQALAGAVLRQVEQRLQETDPGHWQELSRQLSAELAIGIEILPQAEVAGGLAQPGFLRDADGLDYYALRSASTGAYLRIGPFAAPREHWAVRLIPPLFYLAVLAIVAIALWPVMRDLGLIQRAAQAFAGDYRDRIQTADQTSALHGLAQNLDEMSARIHGLIEHQKELTRALSHEMRTPLARIKFALAMDPSDAGQLDSIAADVDEIDRLIAAMLDYARLEQSAVQLNWELTPSGPWLEECASRARDLGPAIEINNTLQGERLRIDPQLMGLAVSNLLVNACRYARSRVRLSLSMEGNDYLLQVDDDGPGIPQQHREAVFDAFSRADSSRNRNTGGYGLGLAIVARVAGLHDGSVVAADSPEGGARIQLRWKRPAHLL